MIKLENVEKITEINFTRMICLLCPLGGDYYSAEISVYMKLGDCYPEYMELDKAIQDFGGKGYNIEQLVGAIYDLMETEYKPKSLWVDVEANGNTHFPIVVTKRSKAE